MNGSCIFGDIRLILEIIDGAEIFCGVYQHIVYPDNTTIEDFFPTDAEGNPLTKRYKMSDGELVEEDFTGWTAQPPLPGEWVLTDGRAGNWSSGAAYWWLNFDQEHYAEIMCEGALCIGNGPNAVHQIGDVVTSYGRCCGIPFNVHVKYVE
jgi:hypothetical protein